LAVPLVTELHDATAQTVAFEVASVKKSAPPADRAIMIRVGARQGDRWLADNATLRMLIRSAYAPRYQMEGQIIGGPNWMDTERFDIVATMEPTATADEMRAMVRSLLASRFKLVLGADTRELPVYFLALARTDGRLGPAMEPINVDCDALRAARQRGEAPLPATQARGTVSAFVGPTTRIESGGVSMAQLLSSLSQSTGRPVLDRTGLTGFFMLKLEFATEPGARTPFGPATPPANDAVAAAAPSLFSAIQDQLGLKLQAGREATEVLVISGAEPPTEN
jgi:uncharacterized protein (TIGR03435 family)